MAAFTYNSSPASIAQFSWVVGTIHGVADLGNGLFILDMGPRAYAAVRLADKHFIACCPSELFAIAAALQLLAMEQSLAQEALGKAEAFIDGMAGVPSAGTSFLLAQIRRAKVGR